MNLSTRIPSVSISWQTLPINATGGELDRTDNEIVSFEKEVRRVGRQAYLMVVCDEYAGVAFRGHPNS
jgi:hypothetical protein